MASAGHATPTAPTRNDAGALSANKTPASRPLNYDEARATASISLKDLTDTWQKQCTYPQEADALVEEKRPARVRRCVAKGLGVLQTLLGQPNTQHRSRRDGFDRTLEARHRGRTGERAHLFLPGDMACLRGRVPAQPLPISCESDCDGAVRLTVMVRSLCR